MTATLTEHVRAILHRPERRLTQRRQQLVADRREEPTLRLLGVVVVLEDRLWIEPILVRAGGGAHVAGTELRLLEQRLVRGLRRVRQRGARCSRRCRLEN